MVTTQEFVDFESIKKLYPDEWVLIGNPKLRQPPVAASIVSQLVGGVVIFHSKDKHELAYKGRELRKGFKSVTYVFTGEIPANRRFWL